MSTTPHTLLVGIGSSHGDDQIGWRIAYELQNLCLPNDSVVIRKAAVPLDMIDWLDGVKTLHLCDACSDRGSPGTLHSWKHDNACRSALETLRASSSHDFGLPTVLQLAVTLGRIPNRVFIHAVTGQRFEPGETLSDGIVPRIPHIATTIYEQLTNARSIPRSLAAQTG